MNRYSIIYFLLALITVFIITAWVVQPFSQEDYERLLIISVFIIFSICGLILVTFALKFNIQAQAKRAWLLIATAIFSWAIGELSRILLLEMENQWISDLFRLLGYLIFVLGLVMQWRILEIQIKKIEILIFVALFGLCLVAILLMLNVPILLDSKPFEKILLTAAYPTIDLFLTFFSGAILWKVKRPEINFSMGNFDFITSQ